MRLVIYRWLKGDDSLVINAKSGRDLWILASRIMRLDVEVSKIYVETENTRVVLLRRKCRFMYAYEIIYKQIKTGGEK